MNKGPYSTFYMFFCILHGLPDVCGLDCICVLETLLSAGHLCTGSSSKANLIALINESEVGNICLLIFFQVGLYLFVKLF